jgi:hypothetical protein
VHAGVSSDYLIQTIGAVTTVKDQAPTTNGDDGTDKIVNVEHIQFSDGVQDVDHAPVITSDGAGDTADVAIAENETAVTTVTATDSDAGQSMTFGIAGWDDAKFFTIVAMTGALRLRRVAGR